MNKLTRFSIKILGGTAVLFLCSLILSLSMFTVANSCEIPVLLYHHILRDDENTVFRNDSVITPELFDEHMNYLYTQGYETITTDELYEFIYNNKQITGKKVLITFDDGYQSNYIYAYDILKKYGYTAAVFLVTSTLTLQPEEFNPYKLDMLSIYELEASKDVFEFGSHTDDMHRADSDGVPFIIGKPKEDVKADIERSFTYPNVKKIFAYPFGDFNRSNIKSLKELGCKLAFTNRAASATKYADPYMIPRYSVRRSMSFNDFKLIFEKTKN